METPTDDKLQEVIEFLDHETKKRCWRIRFLNSGFNHQGNYLSLRATMQLKDAWEKAKRLQVLEDTWNKSPTRKPRITLIPAKTPD